jgi:[ribosomal protein S5]-alanine N-acetyltransferase
MDYSAAYFVGTCGGDFMLSHWDKGNATEAGRALLNCFLNDLKLNSIHSFALPQNQQSLRILEKIGMIYQRDLNCSGLSHRLYRIDQGKTFYDLLSTGIYHT